MSNSALHPKKSAICRYFSSSGSCYYGDNCQFLHSNDTLRNTPQVNKPVNGQSHINSDIGSSDMMGDAYNGDQFFTATFNPNDISNGYQEQVPPFAPGKPGSGHPVGNMSNVSQDDSVLGEQFASMSMTGGPRSKLQTAMKGRNPGAMEFVPKSSAPGSVAGLQHSASSPAFHSYTAHMPPSVSAAPDISTPNLSAGPALSTGASPMASPGLSPAGSPMINRRDNRSPQPSLLAANGAEAPHAENVGGTTYFYSQDDMNSQYQGAVMPNFTMYPGILPHVAHLKPKMNHPTFYMPDESKLEILNRQAITMAQIDADQNPDIPSEVDNYQYLFPLEQRPGNPMHKSNTFGYPTSVYKATHVKDGLYYCLRRIHGFRLTNTKCMALIDLWKKLQHSNVVTLREVFTTKAFADHSMVFAYDYHPGAETLLHRHFSHRSSHHLNGYNNPYNLDGQARPYSAGKGVNRQQAGLLPENLIWSYVVQLSSALRTIHAHGLACRVMDPSKILIIDKSRIRINCVGIFDVLSFDAGQGSPLAVMPHYQQEDLVSLGRVVLALACNSLIGIQREHLQTSIELVSRNYSADLKNLIMYLLSNTQRLRSVNDIMPMIGARFYAQLDAAQLRGDVLENELCKEVESGRLFRLMCKLGVINERPELNLDPAWSETGNRYMLKLFRDMLFHQVDEHGAPWVDMAHIVQCLNKLDAGSCEKLTLMSRDEQNMLVVTYAELKQCLDSSFAEIVHPSHTLG